MLQFRMIVLAVVAGLLLLAMPARRRFRVAEQYGAVFAGMPPASDSPLAPLTYDRPGNSTPEALTPLSGVSKITNSRAFARGRPNT